MLDGERILQVGNTPLVEIKAELPRDVRLFAKLESVNPGGSIKDRPVARMITRALAEGRLSGGRRLLDSSSGNAGISYAMFGALLGVPVSLVVPGNASPERLARIRAHGAELILTDPQEGYDFAIKEARRLASAHPDRYWYADQYSNNNNWQAHYETTGPEILQQVHRATGGTPDLFVAGVGTGGSIVGIGRRLREVEPTTTLAIVIPEVFPGIEGLKPIGEEHDLVPAILDESMIDMRCVISSERALEGCRLLAKQGYFVGPSSGAYVSYAIELAESRKFRRIVTLLNDYGERYNSTGMWDADK